MNGIRPVYWCLVSTTVLVTFVFAVAVLLSIVPYRCLWLEEYYWINDDSYVALYPMLVFAYLLLGWWNLAIPACHHWSGEAPTWAEYTTVTANAVLLAVVAVNLWALWDWVAFDNYRKYGTLPREPQYARHFWHGPVAIPYFIEAPECFAEVDLEGVWHVDNASETSPTIETIIFWRNRTYEASNVDGDLIEQGIWYGEQWSERVVLQSDAAWQVWDREQGATTENPRVIFSLLLFEPIKSYDRSARPLAKRLELERVDQPYNSAPQQRGPRIVSPGTLPNDVGERRFRIYPDAPFE
jgi:hypothetical protein